MPCLPWSDMSSVDQLCTKVQFYVTNSVTTFSLRVVFPRVHIQNLSPHQNQQVYLFLLVLAMIIIDNYLGPTNLRPQYSHSERSDKHFIYSCVGLVPLPIKVTGVARVLRPSDVTHLSLHLSEEDQMNKSPPRLSYPLKLVTSNYILPPTALRLEVITSSAPAGSPSSVLHWDPRS